MQEYRIHMWDEGGKLLQSLVFFGENDEAAIEAADGMNFVTSLVEVWKKVSQPHVIIQKGRSH